MSWADWLFAPRIDHRGWQTPSEASRIFLIITLLVVGWWYWESTHDNIADLDWHDDSGIYSNIDSWMVSTISSCQKQASAIAYS